jgi:hypothetical protein
MAVRSNQYRAICVDAVGFVPVAVGVAEIPVLSDSKDKEEATAGWSLACRRMMIGLASPQLGVTRWSDLHHKLELDIDALREHRSSARRWVRSAHDSWLRFGSLNHVSGSAINPQ